MRDCSHRSTGSAVLVLAACLAALAGCGKEPPIAATVPPVPARAPEPEPEPEAEPMPEPMPLEPSDMGVGVVWKAAPPPEKPAPPERLPKPLTVPMIVCPATAEDGVEGKVVLSVRVLENGTTDRVRVIRGIGHGCDDVAVEALRGARFEPALDTDGRPTDHVIQYNYIFRFE